MRRGRVDLAAKLDLHGLTQIEAEAVLTVFLRRALTEGDRAVLVVTGKGMRRIGDEDPRPGVLRQRLPEWLAGPALRPIISGYAPAHARHGGEGAYYVFLKRPEDK